MRCNVTRFELLSFLLLRLSYYSLRHFQGKKDISAGELGGRRRKKGREERKGREGWKGEKGRKRRNINVRER